MITRFPKSEKSNAVPIIYYHSVADHKTEAPWSFLSIGVETFKKQVNYLKSKKYYSCTWDELNAHLAGVRKLPKKTVMFHFDDGFLDNWSVVYPIMKEAGFKYSVLLTPEFIQDGPVRPFVDVTTDENKASWWGYLNKAEIQEMASSGIVDFQAHGFTHTWYESSDSLVDIYDGDKLYPHVAWNMFPLEKPYWLNRPIDVPFGYPVFEFKKSLELEKRFIPNQEFLDAVMKAYDSNNTKEDNFMKAEEIRKVFKQKGRLGRYETTEEKITRLKLELSGTREFLANITGIPIEYLVFPGGGSTKHTLELAKIAGYKLVSKGNRLNEHSSKLYQVSRLSGAYPFPKFFNAFLNTVFLKLQLERGMGSQYFAKIATLVK